MFKSLLKQSLLRYQKWFYIFPILISLLIFIFGFICFYFNMYGAFITTLFTIILFTLTMFCCIYLIIITIKQYITLFYTNQRYFTNTIPASKTKIILALFLSFVIVGFIIINSLVIPFQIVDLILDTLLNNEHTFFFEKFFSETSIDNNLYFILGAISITFYIINLLLCLNLSKQPKFASKSVLTIIISLIITITIYESIISLIKLSIMNLTISYLISIILTISLIGLEIIFIIKTLKKI